MEKLILSKLKGFFLILKEFTFVTTYKGGPQIQRKVHFQRFTLLK